MVIEARTPEQTVTEEEIKKALAAFGDLGETDIEVGYDSVAVQGKLGVLQRIITAIRDDAEYRQAGYQGRFKNEEQGALAADAINERKRYGVPITAIVDRIIFQGAVAGKAVDTAVGGVNRFNLTTHNAGAPGWKNRQENKTIT